MNTFLILKLFIMEDFLIELFNSNALIQVILTTLFLYWSRKINKAVSIFKVQAEEWRSLIQKLVTIVTDLVTMMRDNEHNYKHIDKLK